MAPEVDMVLIARSLGLDAVRISEPDELSDALQAAFDRDTPLLIDVPISRTRQTRLEYG